MKKPSPKATKKPVKRHARKPTKAKPTAPKTPTLLTLVSDEHRAAIKALFAYERLIAKGTKANVIRFGQKMGLLAVAVKQTVASVRGPK